jgi:hypothetical protein
VHPLHVASFDQSLGHVAVNRNWIILFSRPRLDLAGLSAAVI